MAKEKQKSSRTMPREDQKLARSARVACEKWREYFKQNIDLYHTMHNFVLGSQWTQQEEDDMVKTYRKVPLTANKLGTMANSLLGEQQQNTPQLQVVPMAGCDEQTAELREIMTKDIMLSSDATTAYQVAAGQAGIGGFGAYAVDRDYVHKKSFDQEIVYRYFKDSTRCFWDIGAEKVNKTDGRHAGYATRMAREQFREKYGKEIEENVSATFGITQNQEEIALATQPNESDDPFSWADADAITILYLYKRKYKKETIYKLSNGIVLDQQEMDDLIDKSIDIGEQNAINDMLMQQQMDMQESMPQDDMQEGNSYGMDETGFGVPGQHDILPSDNGMEPAPFGEPEEEEEENENRVTLYYEGEPVRVVETRDIKKDIIKEYLIAGNYILEESEFPADDLPVIFMDNNSYYDKSGKQVTRSFFGDCRDTQRYINYLRTQSAYILKVSRYDQWVGSKKNVASLDTQRNWRDPTNTQGMITYDESPSGAKPEQIRPPELSASLFQQYQLAIEDLYTCTGLYPTRMGQQGNEVSGAAIDARTRQGSYATYTFFNSVNRAIAAGGEIVNQMIPRVYDSERIITLMMPDTGIQNVTINRQADDYGVRIENDIRKGTYQVRLKPGPSYEGQKEQALLSLRDVLQVKPDAFDLIADLYAENLPLSNTIEIKNRLKTLVSPAIIEAGKTGKPPEQQASPEQQAMQMQQQMAQQEMALKAKDRELKEQELMLKKQEIMLEAQFKMQELETERLQTAGELKEQELRYMAETDRTESDRAIAHADNLVRILTHKIQ